MGKFMCHCSLCSPDAISKETLIVAWALSWNPKAYACFVVACFKYMPKTSATSCITWETKTLPLSATMSVGKLECLFVLSIMTFVVFTAVGLDSGYANAYLKNTSIAVMIFS